MEDIMKIVKSFEESGLLIKGVSETTENEAKEQKRGFVSIIVGTLEAGLLGNVFPGKGIHASDRVIQDGEVTNRAGLDF